MELQLGLALPSPIPIPIPFKLLDLNNTTYAGYEPTPTKDSLLKLGQCDIANIGKFLNTSTSTSSSGSSCSSSTPTADARKRPREFDDIFEMDNRARGGTSVPKTLPLLLWSNHPNDDDDDDDDGPNKDLDDNSSSAIFIKNDGEGLVGWPPVKTWRKKLRRQMLPDIGREQNNRAAAAADNVCGGGGGGGACRASNSTYVKVKMEGVAIARKIDVSVHHSFDTLTTTLMTMFGICDENWKSFKLTYQDREGDWLLAQDVPWRTFIRSLKCLKLIRSRAA